MAPVARGGSYDRGKLPACWEVRLLAGRTVRTEGVLWSPGWEHDNLFAAARLERDLHAWPAPLLGTRQSQTHVCLVRVGAGWGSLGFREQTQRGGWGGLCRNRLKRLESDALQLRAFLKEAWAASEARTHCCSLFPCRSSQAAEQECGPEPPPTRCCPWASGAVLSCPLPRSQTPQPLTAATALANSRSGCESTPTVCPEGTRAQPLPLTAPGPGTGCSIVTPTQAGKGWQASMLRTVLAPKKNTKPTQATQEHSHRKTALQDHSK